MPSLHPSIALFPSRWTNNRTGDFPRWRKQTTKCGIDLIMPGAMRASHNVEIVEITAWSCRDDVIALGHQHQVPIVDSDRFIKSLVRVHTLKGKPIGWLKVMVIGLLQVGLMGRILGIVFVRGERGPVASWGNDLNKDQALRFLIGIQDVLDAALRVALTTYFNTHLFRANHTGGK